MDNTIAIRLKSLEEHVNELEKCIEKLWQQWIPFQTEGEKRVVAAAQNIGLRSFKMKRVPERRRTAEAGLVFIWDHLRK